MPNEKFKALVHYVCDRCDDPSALGAIKLNKILWFSDVLSYLNFGKMITQETYKKRQFGPVPSHILQTLEELSKEGKIHVRDVLQYGLKKREYHCLVKADSSVFEEYELDLIDNVINDVCYKHTAMTISDLSHDKPWEAARIGEEIPPFAIFMRHYGEIDEHDMEWAAGVLEKAA